jgi:hypothetical protein
MRINRINRSGAIPKMEIEWLEQGGHFVKDMSRLEQNEYLDTLFQIGNS